MENIWKKSLVWFWLILIYLGFGLLLTTTSQNKNFSYFGLQQIFANITFDWQSSSTWYSSTHPNASVSVSAWSPPAPVAVTLVTRNSH